MKTNAIQGIQAIEPATKVKTDAKNAIDQSAETQHNAIFNNNDATLEEQQAAQQLLDQAVATAKQNINAADTNQEVAQAKDQGTQNILAIQPATQVKTDARNTVNEKHVRRYQISMLHLARLEKRNKKHRSCQYT